MSSIETTNLSFASHDRTAAEAIGSLGCQLSFVSTLKPSEDIQRTYSALAFVASTAQTFGPPTDSRTKHYGSVTSIPRGFVPSGELRQIRLNAPPIECNSFESPGTVTVGTEEGHNWIRTAEV